MFNTRMVMIHRFPQIYLLGITWLFVYLIFPFQSHSAPVTGQLRFWGKEHGFDSREINAIEMENNGMVWLGSRYGLYRFDGNKFISFKRIKGKHPLGTTDINALALRGDQLWIASDQGLYTLNTQTYDVQRIPIKAKNESNIQYERVTAVYKMQNKELIVGGAYQKIAISGKDQKLRFISNPYQKDGNFYEILNFIEDSLGRVWFATISREIFCLQPKTGKILVYQKFPFGIHSLHYSPMLGIVVKGYNKLMQLNTQTMKLTPLNDEIYRFVPFIMPEADTCVWVIRKGAEVYLHSKSRTISFNHLLQDVTENMYRIIRGYRHGNNLWLGMAHGLICITLNNESIHDPISYPILHTARTHSVRGVCEGENKDVYLATYQGLFRLPFPYKDTKPEMLMDSAIDLICYAISYEKEKIWIASEGGGLATFDIKTKTLNRIPIPIEVKNSRFLVSMYNDFPNNRLILGGYNGLMTYQKSSGKFQFIPLVYKKKNLTESMIYQIDTYNNQIWLCTSSGILVCDEQLHPVRHFELGDRKAMCMFIDKRRNRIWVGTDGNGLFSISLSNNKIINFTQKDGLPNDNIAGLSMSENTLWIATFNGISRLNTLNNSFMNYQTSHGLTHNENNHGATFQTRDGQIIMGGLNGYNFIKKQTIDRREQQIFKPFISSLYILKSNSDTTLFNSHNLKKLYVPNDTRVLEFEFGLPDYTAFDKCVYAYKIEGLDKDWNHTGSRNFVRFYSLQPGNYTFRLKAAGSNGIWYEMDHRMQLDIEPELYKKWWFILILLSIVVGGTVAFYRIKVKRIKDLYNLRLQISKDLHDEVGSILTAVGMQAELLEITNNEYEPGPLRKIAETSRMAVSNMRDVVWSIDSSNDTYNHLIDRMNEYLSIVFSNSATDVHFDKNLNTSSQKINLINRQNVYLIFKETINNIVKHSDATKVQIILTVTDHMMELEIINNGNPKHKEEKSGMGLRNLEARANKMKAMLMIDKNNHYHTRLRKVF